MLFKARELWGFIVGEKVKQFPSNVLDSSLTRKMKGLDAIKATINKEIKVMVLIMSVLNNYQTLTTYLVLSTIEDCTWHNVNTRILNEKLMTKKKIETSQVGGELALTAIFETCHKE
jgi:hypothetical protein